VQRRAARCRCSWSVIIRSMDETTLHKNADRVAAIFNALSIFVLVVGALGAIAVLIAGFAGAGMSRGGGSSIAAIVGGIVGALVAVIYTLIAWAGVQLAALVAGYIKVKTALPPATGTGPQYPPS
jgi:hypothetical protein